MPTEAVAVRAAGFEADAREVDARGAAGFFEAVAEPEGAVFDADGFFGADPFPGADGFLDAAGFDPDAPRDGPEPPAGRAEAPGRDGRREDGMP